ncbi:MAG TPA: DUF1223 domain-containing protein [Candidatus Limnocylindrales bacterium]|jgi:hypothetical protein|nr:DUF1223 domain-containing protein [Candidatus Limnocylindrales bacterium]
MARTLALLLVLSGLIVISLLLTSPSAAAPPARKAVVVELFTSEGCSSCPPADELLRKLAENSPSDGVEVIPLGFHVDYWNHLGWRDRFSDAAYSKRQEEYARRFRLDGPYTPQTVIDGSSELVGNDKSGLAKAIASAAAQPQPADVQLNLSVAGKLAVKVLAPQSASGDVWLAITENNLSSQVSAGENIGHTLRHAAVVHEFRRIGALQNGGFNTDIPIALQKDWKRNDLVISVFVQSAAQGPVLGAAAVRSPK